MSEATLTFRDKLVPWYFVAFFMVIFVLDGIFVYLAVTTQTGVITDKAYERGLAFNERLDKAQGQADIQSQVTYEAGVLRWVIEEDLRPVSSAQVRFVRPVQAGYDFSVEMVQIDGVYSVRPEFPMKGRWVAHLSADLGDGPMYHKTYSLFVD